MSWKDQLNRVLGRRRPERWSREQVREFLRETVAPALSDVADELARHGRRGEIEEEPDRVAVRVFDGDDEEFYYAVKVRTFRRATFAFPELTFEDEDRDSYFRAMVYTDEGPQNYGILGYGRDQVIANFMHEYDKQLRWQRPTRPES